MKFLQKYFPKETKSKQKENETAAGVDLYGENFTNAKCNVM
jgi:E3 ubiquitin-protein ligase BAH